MPHFPDRAHARSFRLVCGAEQRPLVEELLHAEGYRFVPEPFSPCCRILLHEPAPLGSSLAAFFGYIYIQDRSAMLPPLALAPAPGARILDMCASPGGKSGFLAQLAGAAGFVLANEPNSSRLATLRANLRQMNLANVGTCRHAGEKLPLAPASWPHILLDPPCSGWGTVNKNPRAIRMWRGEKVNPLISLQRALLRHAERLLMPGGLLLYSTCTTNFAENEAQTAFAENELGLKRIALKPFPGFEYAERPGGEGCLLVEGEASAAQGFYLSLLRKDGMGLAPGGAPAPAAAARSAHGQELPEARAWLSRALPHGAIRVFNGKARFVPDGAAIIPPGFSWQAALLGSWSESCGFAPDARMRCLAAPLDSENPNALVLEDVADVRALLSGTAMRTQMTGRRAALWWRRLPLGFVSLKNGRPIAAFGQAPPLPTGR